MEKVLITGAKGFLGSHLCDYLIQNNYEVVSIDRGDCDLSNFESTSKIISSLQPDFLVHLASRVSPGRSLDDFENNFYETILPTINVSKSISASIKLAIFAGSIEEYGNNAVPFKETMIPRSISSYGWGKISSFYAAHYILSARNIPYTWLRLSLLYGDTVSRKLFFGNVLNGCLGNETVLLTECEQNRDFTYVVDACRDIHKVMINVDRSRGQIINITSGIPIDLKTVAYSIQKIVGKGELKFGALPYRKDELMAFFSSREKFNSLFGESEITPFNTALSQIVDKNKERFK